MRMISVLHIAQTFNVSGRSKIISVLNSYLNLQKIPSKVAVLSLEKNFAERQKEQVFCLGKRDGVDFSSVFNLVKIINRNHVTIIHTHGMGALYYGILAKMFGKAKKHIHVTHRCDENFRPKHPLLKQLIERNLDCVVGVSKSSLSNFEERISPKIPIREVIYNGVELSCFFSTDIEIKDSKKLVVGSVANFMPHKDHETLIRAFELLVKKVDNAKLILVGDGPQIATFKALVRQLGLSSKVVFFGYQENIPQILRLFDIFVLSTKNEGLPVVVLEAMASRIPVVTSDIGPTREIITHEKDGILFPVGDYKSLEESLFRLSADFHRRRSIACAGFQTVREKFTMERMVLRYIELYNQMMRS